MKLTAILILTACLSVAASSGAQTVTLSVKNATVKQVFKEIQKQTGLNVLVDEALLQRTGKVTLQVKDMPVADVLSLCLKNEPLSYMIEDGAIVVKQKPTPVISNERSEEKSPAALVDLKGRIVNESGEPISGASVQVKNDKSLATSTSPSGEFTLTGIDPAATLLISATNIETLEIKVSAVVSLMSANSGIATITTKTKISALDEIIIKPYWTETKRTEIGNSGRITAKDIERQPVTNPLLAIAGRIPGVFITQESGIPGGPVTIRIQGPNSIAKGNDPLIVIDGVPYFADMIKTNNESALFPGFLSTNPSALSFVNPGDIESIEVLKDAEATSIYGSRAANGAIIITTKKGKNGKTKLDINLQQGWGDVTRSIEMLNSRQYLDMRYEAFRNDGIDWRSSSVTANDLKLWDTTRYTNWQKELIGGTAKYTNIRATVSGGNSGIQYLIGGNFNRSTTVFPGDFSNESSSMHFNVNNAPSGQRFSIQLSGGYNFNHNRLPGIDLTTKSLLYEPIAPNLFNTDGSLNWAPNSSGTSTWDNPLVPILYNNYDSRTNNLLSNLSIGYRVMRNLDFKTNFGYTRLQTNDIKLIPLRAIVPENRNTTPNPATAGYGSRMMYSWSIEPQMTYNSLVGKGKLEAVIGTTIQHEAQSYNNITGRGYSNDESMKYPASAATLTYAGGGYEYKYNAIFGRINYNLKNRYIVNLTARRDGSSRFGDKNRFHNFGSIGGAWIFSEENYFKKNISWLSFGKIKGSFGTTGSDQIGNYAYLSLYNNTSAAVPYQGVNGLLPNGLSNYYLQWEETRKTQVGLDLGFLNDHLLFGATYSLNRCSNQLVQYTLPSITGFASVTDNFPAKVQNTSWEFTTTYNIIRRKSLNISSSINLTVPNNKLLSFPNIEKSTYALGTQGVILGKPLGVKATFDYAGIDPSTGLYQFIDANGNLTASPNALTDRIVFINILPKFYGGFQNNIQIKDFELDFLFQFVKQMGPSPNLLANSVNPGFFSKGASNQPVAVLDRWQKPGDDALVQRYSTTSLASTSRLLGSNAIYVDASFIRLKNISLSWKMPDNWLKKIKLQNFALYTQCQNLLTITKYKGLDPENMSLTALPPLRVVTIGVKIGL